MLYRETSVSYAKYKETYDVWANGREHVGCSVTTLLYVFDIYTAQFSSHSFLVTVSSRGFLVAVF
jgi:hypothetical protein